MMKFLLSTVKNGGDRVLVISFPQTDNQEIYVSDILSVCLFRSCRFKKTTPGSASGRWLQIRCGMIVITYRYYVADSHCMHEAGCTNQTYRRHVLKGFNLGRHMLSLVCLRQVFDGRFPSILNVQRPQLDDCNAFALLLKCVECQ